MSKSSKSVKQIVKTAFYWNTNFGKGSMLMFLIAISAWFLWSDHQTACSLATSTFNQFKLPIVRELELNNDEVALNNFKAFLDELRNIGVTSNLILKRKTGFFTDDKENSTLTCSPGIFHSKIKGVLKFYSKINGTVSGTINYFPSLWPILILWTASIAIFITLRKIESDISENLQKNLIKPIENLSAGQPLQKDLNYPLEVLIINKNILELTERIIYGEKLEGELMLANQLNTLAAQVSHDIRSPLSALGLIISRIPNLPEDKRAIISGAINRINDIANQLLHRRKNLPETAPSLSSTTMEFTENTQYKSVLSIVETAVSEKRIQIDPCENLQIETDFINAYGFFAKINGSDLASVISNILTNSIEAVSGLDGKISISIRQYDEEGIINIQDNGKGISEANLIKIGTPGFTYGKGENQHSGNGLGIFHAKKTIESVNGKIIFYSKEGVGTSVTIRLPKIKPPDWFLDKLDLPKKVLVVSVDNDIFAHQIWKDRLEFFRSDTVPLQHNVFTSGEALKNWLNSEEYKTHKEECLFLFDHDLGELSETGIHLIEKYKIAKNSILVTANSEENELLHKCNSLNLKIISKNTSGFIPIEII